MTFVGNTVSWRFALGLACLTASIAAAPAHAQAPYLLPYTISTIAGGGTAPVIGAACPGANGTTTTAEDTLGDGCLASSSSVVTTNNIHDIAVDPIGTVYFIDIGTTTVVRAIDPHSGIINVLAGSVVGSTVCAATIDAYGDNCPANDGKGNAKGGYTASLPVARGMNVAKNGDVYVADYSGSVVYKISASTGLMTLAAGFVSGGTVVKPTGNKGTAGYTGDGGPATSGELRNPRGVSIDAAGNIFIADSSNNVIRKVTASTGNISTVVGAYPGSNVAATAGAIGDGGPATAAQLSTPEDVEVDGTGNIFIGDFGNNKVRVVYAGGAAVASLIAKTNGGAVAVVGSIYTVVGGGAAILTPGSIVLATSVPIGNPRKIALDARGNIYIADNSFNVIWFVDATTGYMRNIAGTYNAITGSTCTTIDAVGDGCLATLATLSANSAMGVAVGPQGDVYISDSLDQRVRKVSINTTFPAVAANASVTQNLIVHFAASDTQAAALPFTITGSPDFAVTGPPACGAANPDLTTDCTIAITFTPSRPGPDLATLIVKSTAGLTSQFALGGIGTASSVALDPGTTALVASGLSSPAGMAQDAAGNTFIADTGNNRVMKIAVGGASTVLAGTGTSGYSGDSGLATAAKLAGPKAVAVAPDGVVYIADTGNNVIRRVDPVTGIITTYGGGATVICAVVNDPRGDGCPAISATFSAPAGLVADPMGNLYVADTGNSVIREIGTTGYIFYIAGGATTVCGSDVFGNGCAPSQAIFKGPTSLAIDTGRNLYVADTGNNEIRKIIFGTATVVNVVAGTGQSGGSGNGGLATAAQVNGPTGIAVDAANNIYIADTGNHVVRVVTASGNINTVAGTLGASGTGTLPGSAATVLLNAPAGVVSNGIGNLSVLDSGNNRAFSIARGSASFNFGRTNLGSSSPTTSILETSTGSATATVETSGSQLFTTTGNTAVFTLAGSASNGCTNSSTTGYTLAPGVSCSLTAQFTPGVVGPATATYTEASATTVNSPKPAITLIGTGAVLTKTTVTTAVTTPATGSPQYSISFVVTATLHPAVCDPTAPDCTAAGTVTFFVDGTQVGLPVTVSNTSTTSSNVITASQTIGGQSVGTHAVVAVYSGDTYYASSTAPSLAVGVAQGATTTVVTATPASLNQFAQITLTAKVTSATTNIPTGTVAFYCAGGTYCGTKLLLGTVGVNPTTGVATLNDSSPATTLGLYAGSYTLTGVYSGDANYATSTSASTPLTVNADPQAFTIALSSATVGTAQGSTAQTLVYITPSNTLSGTVSLACSGLPANSVCTFSTTPSATQTGGTTLTFTPVPGPAVQQSTSVTLWTDVSPNAIPTSEVRPFTVAPASGTSLAAILGWPALLMGLAGVVVSRKRLRHARLLGILALFGLLAGSATVFTGCTGSQLSSSITPVGSYAVTLTVSGPNSTVQTTKITFTVGPGVAGQF